MGSSIMREHARKILESRAVPERPSSRLSDSAESQASDELDPKTLADRDRIQSEIQHVMTTKDSAKAAKLLATDKARYKEAKRVAETKADEYEDINLKMRQQMDELVKENEEFQQESYESRKQVNQLTKEIEDVRKALEKRGKEKEQGVSSEELQALQDKADEMKEKLQEREIVLKATAEQLKKAEASMNMYKSLLGDKNDTIIEKCQRTSEENANLLGENVELRKRLGEFSRHIDAYYSNIASRTNAFSRQGRQSVLKEWVVRRELPPKHQLVSGTINAPMPEAYDNDIAMTTIPDPHIIPDLVRVRRRLGHTRTRLRRAGASLRSATRPTELRKGHSERRAASTYLQYKDGRKENLKALKGILNRNSGIPNVIPRKRTRLEKSFEITRRAEREFEEFVSFWTGCRRFARSHRLPALAENLQRKISPNPYDKRDDLELSKLMQGFSMQTQKTVTVELPKDTETEARLVTITRTVRPFIPRPNVLAGARYLPKQPKPVPVDVRREWSKKASSWSLGPGVRKKPSNKTVRFAEKVEYEPEQQTKRWEPETLTEPSLNTSAGWPFSWSQLIIVFLLFLLFFTNMKSEDPKVVGWKEANSPPDEIVARLRSAGQGNGNPTIVDFEMARWSDVDPSIYG